MRVGLCTTVFRPPLFRWWLQYHRASGFGPILVFIEDDPDDSAIADAAAVDGVTVVRCDRAYWEDHARSTTFEPLREIAERLVVHPNGLPGLPRENSELVAKQRMNADFAIRRLRDEGCDWVLHIDDDELFFSPEESVNDHFASLEPDIGTAVYLNLEALPERCDVENCFSDVTLFKVNAALWDDKTTEAFTNGAAGAIWRERGWFFQKYGEGKSACRPVPGAASTGPHHFVVPELDEMIASPPFILHYPYFCDRARWMKDCERRQGWNLTRSDGTSIPFPFHHASLGVYDRDDPAKARQFYESNALIDDPGEIARQIEAGLVVRLPPPGRR